MAVDQVESQNALVWIEGVDARGHCHIVRPHPPPFVPSGSGVVGVRGGACVDWQSCLSFKIETEQVRAHCGTSSVWLRLRRAELRLTGDLSRVQVLKTAQHKSRRLEG